MTSFCLLLLGALASFIISRMCKSASLYVFLVCVLLLGFVVGTGVKKVVANTSDTTSQELVTTDREDIPTMPNNAEIEDDS